MCIIEIIDYMYLFFMGESKENRLVLVDDA